MFLVIEIKVYSSKSGSQPIDVWFCLGQVNKGEREGCACQSQWWLIARRVRLPHAVEELLAE
jgi:hypothetical protein